MYAVLLDKELNLGGQKLPEDTLIIVLPPDNVDAQFAVLDKAIEHANEEDARELAFRMMLLAITHGRDDNARR